MAITQETPSVRYGMRARNCFHIVSVPSGYMWYYIGKGGVEIARSCSYKTSSSCNRSLARFLKMIRERNPDIKYKGFLTDCAIKPKDNFGIPID